MKDESYVGYQLTTIWSEKQRAKSVAWNEDVEMR